MSIANRNQNVATNLTMNVMKSNFLQTFMVTANTNVGHATIEVNAFGPEDGNGNVVVSGGATHAHMKHACAIFWVSNKHTMRCATWANCHRPSTSVWTQAQELWQKNRAVSAQAASPIHPHIYPKESMAWQTALNIPLNSESPSRDDGQQGVPVPGNIMIISLSIHATIA